MKYFALLTLAVLLLSGPKGFAEVKSDIEYGTAGGESLKLDARVPDGAGPFPVVIYVHGGGWASGDKADVEPLAKAFLDAPFTVFSVNYRLAPAHRWPASLEDVTTAVRWIKAHAAEFKGDPARVALLGHSAGGQLAFMAAQSADDATRVAAVVGMAPVTDCEIDLPQRGGLSKSLQDLLDKPKEVTDESRQLLRDLAPINHIKPDLPPYLILQGSGDKTVQHQQSVNFQAKLRAAGGTCDLITIDRAPHRFTEWDKFDPQFRTYMVDWLKRTLSSPASPATQPIPSSTTGVSK